MPKFKPQYKLTATLGAWETVDVPGVHADVILTASPDDVFGRGEALFASGGRQAILIRVDWETLVQWGMAREVEEHLSLEGCLLEIGESTAHSATPGTGQVMLFVRISVEAARALGGSLGKTVRISPEPD
jgi:hypothetical protein